MNLSQFWKAEADKLRDTSHLRIGIDNKDSVKIEWYPTLDFKITKLATEGGLTAESIHDFITNLENFERKYEIQTLADMATHLRKLYYNTEAWDFIIPNRKSVPKFIDDEKLKYAKIIIDERNFRLNIQHVFVGLDSINFPTKTVITRKIKTVNFYINNYDAATWAGDIGTVSGFMSYELSKFQDKVYEEYFRNPKGANEMILKRWTNFLEKECSPEDILGDIDGIVLGWQIYNRKNQKVKMSQILKDYYAKEGDSKRRIEKFTTSLGLIYDKKTQLFKNQDSVIESYKLSITEAAMLNLLRKDTGYAIKLINNNYQSKDFTGFDASKYLLKNFFNALLKQLNKS